MQYIYKLIITIYNLLYRLSLGQRLYRSITSALTFRYKCNTSSKGRLILYNYLTRTLLIPIATLFIFVEFVAL